MSKLADLRVILGRDSSDQGIEDGAIEAKVERDAIVNSLAEKLPEEVEQLLMALDFVRVGRNLVGELLCVGNAEQPKRILYHLFHQ